jgi:5S rRNA maturation endonuclease (ribonuclease M5)
MKIEDVRGNKRDYIVERAKKLLEGLDSSDGDMAKSVREESRVARIGEYGEDKLPCGDLSGNEIIVVEGRADVVNLIKNRVFNVIGMSGAKWSKDISRLSEDKELTLFVDGDRGGKLIAKNVIANANIVYVAVAPDGKEVEELQGKEILMSLRKRWPVQEYMRRAGRNGDDDSSENGSSNAEIELSRDEVKKKVRELYADIKDSKKAMLLDASLNVVRTVSAGSALGSMMRSDVPIKAVIIDGAATSSMIDACDEKGVTYLAARNFSHIEGAKVQLISL